MTSEDDDLLAGPDPRAEFWDGFRRALPPIAASAPQNDYEEMINDVCAHADALLVEALRTIDEELPPEPETQRLPALEWLRGRAELLHEWIYPPRRRAGGKTGGRKRNPIYVQALKDYEGAAHGEKGRVLEKYAEMLHVNHDSVRTEIKRMQRERRQWFGDEAGPEKWANFIRALGPEPKS